MAWHVLLFAHGPVELAQLRALIPAGPEIDTYDGGAWLGIVPFRTSSIRHRLLPELPDAAPLVNFARRLDVVAWGRHRPADVVRRYGGDACPSGRPIGVIRSST